MPLTDLEQRVTHGYADSGGVKIHYAALGSGPLIVMIHGFPDYWLTWRHQMEALAKTHRVAAIDLRGYNLSDKPAGVDAYDMRLLVQDVAAVIKANGATRATVIGHDWGGAIAWSTAMHAPQLVERLIIVNLPHLRGLARELARNPEQQKNSQYARNLQQPDAHTRLSAEKLAELAPADVRSRYLEAFQRSSFESMTNYYKRNYPREPYAEPSGDVPRVAAPVLQFHGLKDSALLPGALNGTWDWVAGPFTLVTIPDAGHWSHWDAAEQVTRTMVQWLERP
ncbi:MAG: alpha/beta hydrolase [Acidobacteria bacterium]|nr:alpha/beta hydrolase [Acidobacteriota bacterium]